MNIVATNATAGSYLTVWPADQPKPLASSLNYVAGQPPTPNGVTSQLSADGRLALYNFAGAVDVVVDIVGYYSPVFGGTPGTKGDPGATGPQGPVGPPGPLGSSCYAQERWAEQCEQFGIDLGSVDGSIALAFDGTNVWVANSATDNLTRVNAATGSTTTFALPAGASGPRDVLFDGVFLWTANYYSDNLTRINLSSMAMTNISAPTMNGPAALADDGDDIFVVNNLANSVTKVSGSTVFTVALPAGATAPSDIVFDGQNLWTSNSGTNNLTRLNTTTLSGTNVALPAGATGPAAITFDGVFLWTANTTTNNITRIPTTGSGTNFPLPAGASGPVGITYDGRDVYVAASATDNVVRVRTATGAGIALPVVAADFVYDVISDGTRVWAVGYGNGILGNVPS
jgi:streptogramin lyase